MLTQALLLGAVVWFVTTVIVESEILRPMREVVERRAHEKLAYLIHCHMCAGTWVGLAVGFVAPLPFHTDTVVARILSGLAYKAVGHLILAVNNFLERCAR